MLGAIIGDIVGARFEWNNNRSKQFDFLTYKCFPTDDSIMSLAVARAILISKPDYSDLSKNTVECMQSIGRNYMAAVFIAGCSRTILNHTTATEMAPQ